LGAATTLTPKVNVFSSTEAIFEGGSVSHFRLLGKGNKRRVQQVRWKRLEILHAILLLIVVSVLVILVTIWFEGHNFD
jgi:hypothetical protein